MSVPLRKDQLEEELTTADLAQGKRPAASEELRPQPARSGPIAMERTENVSALEKDTGDNDSPEEIEPQYRGKPDGRARDEATPLFPENELDELRNRWNSAQAAFVDEPRHAVEQADSLVASAMKRLAEVFAEERSRLEGQWDRGDNVSTEDLRIALQRYRSFFHRLLAI